MRNSGAISVFRFWPMNQIPDDSDKRMIPKDQMDSPSIEEGSSVGSLNGGNPVLKKGPWTSAEDAILMDYVKRHGEGNWNAVQKHTGLSRCGKSCRLRWANHLRPNLKKGAFTPEEEQLIVELHAKMGNKWARMAGHLPGRTDNEIKNYWNTRVKRRQRAGLPLYPPNLCYQIADENQRCNNSSEYFYYGKHPTDSLLGSDFDICDTVFDNFDADHSALAYARPFSDAAVTSMLSKKFGSQKYFLVDPTVSSMKRPRDSESLFPALHSNFSNGHSRFGHPFLEPLRKMQRTSGLGYHCDPDPSSKNLQSFGSAIPSSHAFLNGTFSASSPSSGTVKLELPSLQHTEIDGSSWLACSSTPLVVVDTYGESAPATVSLQTDCVSPHNSGLLDALVHEAQVISCAKKEPSEKRLGSVIIPDNVVKSSELSISEKKFEEFNDPISPLGCSAASIFSEFTPLIGGSSLDELPHSNAASSSGDILMTAEHVSSPIDGDKDILIEGVSVQPDAFVGSPWFEDNSLQPDAKDYSIFDDAIAIFMGQDLSNDYNPLPAGRSSAHMQAFGLDSCPWNNMPNACQMP
ncbi:hypothetical protein Cni_G04281 [Canna indica]|uniref:Transcription factor GAMYB n=1 Tax=Canna indica TaxID=4628 RepID=A0AAQ3Q4C1_9LILI|nr:hypothetical protein Cni_G04281 [Canna indica]